MSDLKTAIHQIAGVDVTPATIQRIQAIAHSLGIAENDAMFPILVMLDTYHGAFSGAPVAVATSITTAAENIAGVIDAAAKKSVHQEMAVAKNDMREAAVSVFGGLATEARDAIIKAGKDIAAVDKAKAEFLVKIEHTKLMNKFAMLGVAIFLAAGLAGVGIQYGLSAASIARAGADVRAAKTQAKAAEALAKEAVDGSAAAAKLAVDLATKTVNTQLANLTAKMGWFATKDGSAVLACSVAGWRKTTFSESGKPACVIQESKSPMIGQEVPAISFAIPK